MSENVRLKDEILARFRHKIAELETSKKQLKEAKEEIRSSREKLLALI